MTNNTEYLLHLEDVVKRYRNQKGVEFTVLNDIDLKVRKGEFITIIGPSGCGKSTMLRLILGSEQPSEGSVLFNGKPILSPDRDRGIVFQKYSLFPHLTVLENLTFGLDMEDFTIPGRLFKPFHLRAKRKEYREKASDFLDRVGLSGEGDKFPQQLSGGMRQRVAIAQSLIMEPQILLMDEPFGALDDSTRQDMQLFILEQCEKMNMTIFFVTHDLEEAVFLGTRIIVLSHQYMDDRGEGRDVKRGAKVIADHPLPVKAKSVDVKKTAEFGELIEEIRLEVDVRHQRHVKDFNLKHPFSWRTLQEEEFHPEIPPNDT